ncbi:hypothetical protein DFH07DRAFT_756735 [Mycena maculata]|uniref:Peroxisomal membrane protein n=1 Tax=Mycena maculata TaxID=230809 RepID=A0AAD7HY05_9AGAR|nr:hypothetical protein DFH07DRAFT_756735 [Mycena maculata]
MSNPGYTNLLAHLHNPSTSLPLPTIQSAIAHHLAKLLPLPTPLAATTVSSPLFSAHPFSHPRLQTLFTAFRHATHLKHRDSKNAAENQSAVSSVFARSTRARVKQWASAVLKGIKGGQPILRLACCGGLLAGLEDLELAEGLEIGRSQLEDEVVISVAESMDMYARTAAGGWEAEFQPVGDVDTMTLALILASQSLVLVAPGKLRALPLSLLTDLLTFTIASTFASGTFLSTASSSSVVSLCVSTSSSSLRTINESPLMQFIASISKLTALTLTILCDSRPVEGMITASATLESLRPISKSLESDWITNPLAKANPDTHELVWTTLKTLLFTNIMVADAALSAAVFVPPAAYTAEGPTPSTLALTVLHTLSNLSFVVSQFGGVTTTASPGFVELKKTFYLALDILAKSAEESNRFVRELCVSVREWQGHGEEHDVQAKTAYALTCIEQLIPMLSGDCIQSFALPLALPHLSDPTYRETYESSHSVVLAIFASHADHHAAGQENINTSDVHAPGPGFTYRMVPFYAHCLIENSVDGRLSTPQLRLAFASLVRSASASAHNPNSPQSAAAGDLALALYCVDALLDAIHALAAQDPAAVEDRLHRLRLTLVSVVPVLPLKLLPRVLEELRAILATQSDGGKVKDLVDTIFLEISESASDLSREHIMRWWYENRISFLDAKAAENRISASRAAHEQHQSRL